MLTHNQVSQNYSTVYITDVNQGHHVPASLALKSNTLLVICSNISPTTRYCTHFCLVLFSDILRILCCCIFPWHVLWYLTDYCQKITNSSIRFWCDSFNRLNHSWYWSSRLLHIIILFQLPRPHPGLWL